MLSSPNKVFLGAVAQLVAHLHGMQGVRGSSPLSSTPLCNLSLVTGESTFTARMSRIDYWIGYSPETRSLPRHTAQAKI
jgi:hypothetical protein